MAKHKVYKLIVCAVDHAMCSQDGLEVDINTWALEGYELVSIDIKAHNGATCWMAVMVKEVKD